MRGIIKSEYQNTYKKEGKRSRRKESRAFCPKHILPLFVLSFSLILSCTAFGSFLSSAHGIQEEAPVNFKYYKSITINKGDTLWNIAEEYITDDYDSIEEYIYALKVMNRLEDDDYIQAGQKIIIAYNDTNFIE